MHQAAHTRHHEGVAPPGHAASPVCALLVLMPQLEDCWVCIRSST